MRAQMVDGELVLHGPVGEAFEDDAGLKAADVRAALTGRSGDLMVRLNSPGGDAFEGAAIHAVLSGFEGRVTVWIEGVALSAGSLIAMAGHEIVMAEGAMMMIHDPANLTWGTADDHRAVAEMMDRIAEEYAAVYARRSGQTPEAIRTLMKQELWMGGEEAVARGFADRVEQRDRPAIAACAFPYGVFQNAPAPLIAMADRNGWVADGPRPPRAALPAEEEEADMPTQTTPADNKPDTKTAGAAGAPAPAMQATPPAPAPAATPAPEVAVDVAPLIAADARRKAVMQATPPAQSPSPAATPAPAPAPVPEMSVDVATLVAADARRKAVMKVAGQRLTAAQVEQIVASTGDAADAKMAAVDLLCEMRMADEPAPTVPRAQITGDADERRAEGIMGALGARMFGGPLEGPAEAYRGMTMKRLAIELAGGLKPHQSEVDVVRAGLGARGVIMAAGAHSTSDFAYITAETTNRALRRMYNSRPGTWRKIGRQRLASDFRTLYSVQSGLDAEMRKVNEAGEYESTVMSDTGESFAVDRYGREVTITFEAIVNDDLSAFNRLPQDFSRGALNLESRICWGLIASNPNMSDGAAFFANTAARGRNLAGSGAAISVTSVGAGRKVMWEQRPHGAKATGDDFIEAMPNLLVAPPALDAAANQFVTTTTPDSDGNTNPYKRTLEVIIEPRIGGQVSGGSDTAWYLFDERLPAIEYAFLQGYEAPTVQADQKMNPRGVNMIAEHIFGAGLVEFRGAYKNPGV